MLPSGKQCSLLCDAGLGAQVPDVSVSQGVLVAIFQRSIWEFLKIKDSTQKTTEHYDTWLILTGKQYISWSLALRHTMTQSHPHAGHPALCRTGWICWICYSDTSFHPFSQSIDLPFSVFDWPFLQINLKRIIVFHWFFDSCRRQLGSDIFRAIDLTLACEVGGVFVVSVVWVVNKKPI